MATSSNTCATYGEILRCGAGFTFVDFLPRKIEPSGLFRSTYENFGALIDRANEFLRSNRGWKIVSCESVEFKSGYFNVNPIKMTYLENGKGHNSFTRGLRLWLTERKDEKEKEQQIGYINLIPEQLENGCFFKDPKFETWDSLIQGFNSKLQSNPLPGSEINTQRMDYTEKGSRITYSVRILRMAFTKSFENPYPYSISEKPTLLRELTCRTFTPLQIATGVFVPEYENLVVTKERISAWIRATGARVVSAETTAHRIRFWGETKDGIETTFNYNRDEKDEYWMFVIRLYLDGVYREPPPEMLPAEPYVEKFSCNVS